MRVIFCFIIPGRAVISLLFIYSPFLLWDYRRCTTIDGLDLGLSFSFMDLREWMIQKSTAAGKN